MKKELKIILIAILIGIIGLMFLNKNKKENVQIKRAEIFAGIEDENEQDSENIYNVSSWQELKEVIEETEKSNIEINLLSEISNTWIADSTIEVKKRQEYYNYCK